MTIPYLQKSFFESPKPQRSLFFLLNLRFWVSQGVFVRNNRAVGQAW